MAHSRLSRVAASACPFDRVHVSCGLVSRCRERQGSYNPKGMEYAAQTQLTALTVPLGENMTLCRDHVREVIRQCLTEVQKMHIGATPEAVARCVAAGSLHGQATT